MKLSTYYTVTLTSELTQTNGRVNENAEDIFLITTHNISEPHCSLFYYMFCCQQVPCCCILLLINRQLDNTLMQLLLFDYCHHESDLSAWVCKVCETRMENWKVMGGKTDLSAFLSKSTSAGFPKWLFNTICFYRPFILDFDNAPLSLLYISCYCFSICLLVRNNEVAVTTCGLRQQTSKATNVSKEWKLSLHC